MAEKHREQDGGIKEAVLAIAQVRLTQVLVEIDLRNFASGRRFVIELIQWKKLGKVIVPKKRSLFADCENREKNQSTDRRHPRRWSHAHEPDSEGPFSLREISHKRECAKKPG
jgi:hypothetical protein